MFESFHQLFFKPVQFRNDLKTGGEIFLIGKFSPDRFTFLISFNRTLIDTSHNIIKEHACLSKVSYKRNQIPFLQICARMNSKLMHLLRSNFPDPVKLLNSQLFDECFGIAWFYKEHSVRFVYIRCNLSKEFVY